MNVAAEFVSISASFPYHLKPVILSEAAHKRGAVEGPASEPLACHSEPQAKNPRIYFCSTDRGIAPKSTVPAITRNLRAPKARLYTSLGRSPR